MTENLSSRRPAWHVRLLSTLMAVLISAGLASPTFAIDEGEMMSITCTATPEASHHPQYAGLCAALSEALSPLVDQPFAFHFTAISSMQVALDLTAPASAGGAPLPLQFVIVDRDLSPELHDHFANSILRSLQRQGLVTVQ